MGTKFREMVCDEHDIGGSGEYFSDIDAHLDPITCFTTRPWWASAFSARCSSTSSPA
jgi:hypothetical protein